MVALASNRTTTHRGGHTPTADGATCLWYESDLPLMPDREHPHLADGPGRRDGRVRILACQKLKGALEVGQCPRRIDYRRHGFGRAAS